MLNYEQSVLTFGLNLLSQFLKSICKKNFVKKTIKSLQVYAWLWKTVVNDALRNDVLNFSGTPDSLVFPFFLRKKIHTYVSAITRRLYS